VVGNAAPVVIQGPIPGRSRILVPFCINNTLVMVTYSDDNGRSFAPPRDITKQASKPGWQWYGLGPPGGLVIPAGSFSGNETILIPGYHGSVHWLDGTFTHSHVIASTDGGDNWSILFEFDNSSDPYFSNECQLARHPNGSLILSARTIAFNRA